MEIESAATQCGAAIIIVAGQAAVTGTDGAGSCRA